MIVLLNKLIHKINLNQFQHLQHVHHYFFDLKNKQKIQKDFIDYVKQEKTVLIRNDKEVKISYSISKEYRNRGYGAEMIREGANLIREIMPSVELIYADVKKENSYSKKVLLENGYKLVEENDFLVFVKNCVVE